METEARNSVSIDRAILAPWVKFTARPTVYTPDKPIDKLDEKLTRAEENIQQKSSLTRRAITLSIAFCVMFTKAIKFATLCIGIVTHQRTIRPSSLSSSPTIYHSIMGRSEEEWHRATTTGTNTQTQLNKKVKATKVADVGRMTAMSKTNSQIIANEISEGKTIPSKYLRKTDDLKLFVKQSSKTNLYANGWWTYCTARYVWSGMNLSYRNQAFSLVRNDKILSTLSTMIGPIWP